MAMRFPITNRVARHKVRRPRSLGVSVRRILAVEAKGGGVILIDPGRAHVPGVAGKLRMLLKVFFKLKRDLRVAGQSLQPNVLALVC